MADAYLLIALDVSQTPPTVLGADIFSDSAREMTTTSRTLRWVEHSHVKAESYQEALDILARTLHSDYFRMTDQWVVELLEKSGTMPPKPEARG